MCLHFFIYLGNKDNEAYNLYIYGIQILILAVIDCFYDICVNHFAMLNE